jgi:arylsulfatase B
MALSATFAIALALGTSAATAAKPHLIFLLTDDLGWGGLPGFGGQPNGTRTPALDAMRAEGLTLHTNYAFQFCSPSRGAFMTGRYPYKLPQSRCNFLPASIPEGTPLEYTFLPAKLAPAGYVSAHIGKWHLGLFSPEYTPLLRGFNTTDSFLTGGEDHFDQTCDAPHCDGTALYDVWQGNATAPQLQGQYTGYRFNDAAVNTIATHAATYGADTPLFLYFAMHDVHAPTEAEPKYLAKYANVSDKLQRTWYAMMSTVDDAVANVTSALKEAGMWDNSVVVWMSDNGSPIQVAGSNYPLRGCKGSNWEGGMKVPAIVSGGLLPASQRGKTTRGVSHIVDFYATFAGLAGVPAADPHGPDPSIDSLDLWPWLSGATPNSPRDAGLTVLDHSMYRNVTTGAIRNGKYKLLVGGSFSSGVGPEMGEWAASWYGLFSPNSTFNGTDTYACPPSAPCLYDLEADPTEHVDLSASLPAVTAQMLSTFYSLNATYHPPVLGPAPEPGPMCAAVTKADGKMYIAPWK